MNIELGLRKLGFDTQFPGVIIYFAGKSHFAVTHTEQRKPKGLCKFVLQITEAAGGELWPLLLRLVPSEN